MKKWMWLLLVALIAGGVYWFSIDRVTLTYKDGEWYHDGERIENLDGQLLNDVDKLTLKADADTPMGELATMIWLCGQRDVDLTLISTGSESRKVSVDGVDVKTSEEFQGLMFRFNAKAPLEYCGFGVAENILGGAVKMEDRFFMNLEGEGEAYFDTQVKERGAVKFGFVAAFEETNLSQYIQAIEKVKSYDIEHLKLIVDNPVAFGLFSGDSVMQLDGKPVKKLAGGEYEMSEDDCSFLIGIEEKGQIKEHDLPLLIPSNELKEVAPIKLFLSVKNGKVVDSAGRVINDLEKYFTEHNISKYGRLGEGIELDPTMTPSVKYDAAQGATYVAKPEFQLLVTGDKEDLLDNYKKVHKIVSQFIFEDVKYSTSKPVGVVEKSIGKVVERFIRPVNGDLAMTIPSKQPHTKNSIEPMLISVLADGAVKVNKKDLVDLKVLKQRLHELNAQCVKDGSKPIIQIFTTPETTQQSVIDVLNAIRGANINTVTFTDSDETGESRVTPKVLPGAMPVPDNLDTDVKPSIANNTVSASDRRGRIVINVRADGTFSQERYKNVMKTSAEIQAYVEESVRKYKELDPTIVPKIHLRGSEDALFKHSQIVMKAAAEAGVTRAVFSVYNAEESKK